jgi:hypothetical protein
MSAMQRVGLASWTREPGTSPRPVPFLVPAVTTGDLSDLDPLDGPRLVLSEGYHGVDRRNRGIRPALSRTIFRHRRSLFRRGVLSALALMKVAVVVASTILLTGRPHADDLDRFPKFKEPPAEQVVLARSPNGVLPAG